jgi:hypothetical protein
VCTVRREEEAGENPILVPVGPSLALPSPTLSPPLLEGSSSQFLSEAWLGFRLLGPGTAHVTGRPYLLPTHAQAEVRLQVRIPCGSTVPQFPHPYVGDKAGTDWRLPLGWASKHPVIPQGRERGLTGAWSTLIRSTRMVTVCSHPA